jgi:hypothetical protein
MRVHKIYLIAGLLMLALCQPLLAAKSATKAKPAIILARPDTSLQNLLEPLLPDSLGFRVTTPLDLSFRGNPDLALLLRTVRVVCPDLTSLQRAIRVIKDTKAFKITNLQHDIEKARKTAPAGYRGAIVRFKSENQESSVQILTLQQLRWLIWAKGVYGEKTQKLEPKSLQAYAIAVSDYLDALDRGTADPATPKAVDFGLSESVDLFPPIPTPSNQGARYEELIHANAEIKTEFARGITAFIPTESTLEGFISAAPRESFVDREAVMFQWHFRQYAIANGDLQSLQTLTARSLAALAEGEYFFAVGLDSTLRCGQMPTFMEAKTRQNRTWKGYEAMLFPCEPVLTAGTFVVERIPWVHLARVTVNSETYFFSSLSPTVEEEITSRSDHHLLTLGHFFRALQRMGVPCRGILISKF